MSNNHESLTRLESYLPTSIEAQLANITQWSSAYSYKRNALSLSESPANEPESLYNANVVTPFLGTTTETFNFLWKIIAQNSVEGAESQIVLGDKNSEVSVLNIDEELPTNTPRFNNRFHHFGKSILDRPSNGVTVSTINILKHYSKELATVENDDVSGIPIPFQVRKEETASGIETLAFLAHNPDFVANMGIDSVSLPWLWLAGCQYHDLKGNVTPRTPLVSKYSKNDKVRLSAQWNDSGNKYASIPEFTKLPTQI